MEESFVSDVDTPVSTEVNNNKKGPKVLISLLSVFLILSLGGLAYFVLKDNGIDLLKSIKSEVTEENITQDEQEDTVEQCISCQKDVATSNKGWALFSLPEYGFSVEIPTYRMSQDNFIPEGISTSNYSYWKVRHADYAPESFFANWYMNIHKKLEHHIEISFFPTYLPEGCGPGCMKENFINVYIFEKSSSDTWDSVKDKYVNALELFCPPDDGSCSQESTIVRKWNMDVLSLSIIFPGAGSNHNVLINGKYIYHIQYFFTGSPEESLQVAQKILDSMRFE